MNSFLHRAQCIAFFYASVPRIICSRLRFSALGLALERFFFVRYLGCAIRGGVAFWRGNVFARGVNEQGGGWVKAQEGGGAKRGAFGKAAAGLRLAECLPANTKGGGDLCGAGVEGGKGGKERGHGSFLINRARGRVMVTRAGVVVQYQLPLCQLVVDGPVYGQLNLPIAVACGIAMKINQGFVASGRDYVLAVFSRRVRGYALPLDLVRVQVRVADSVGTVRRTRQAFADYLVTDGEAGYPFRNRRKNHQMRRVGVFGTGFQLAACFGGDLDAPEWILGGSVVESLGGPFQSGVRRGEL